jgi:hypothetical protein
MRPMSDLVPRTSRVSVLEMVDLRTPMVYSIYHSNAPTSSLRALASETARELTSERREGVPTQPALQSHTFQNRCRWTLSWASSLSVTSLRGTL